MGQTFYEYMQSQLENSGMHQHQIEAVMPIIMADESMSNMRSRWSDQVDGYPLAIAKMLLPLARPVIYKWISENIPEAWFRPVFAPGVENCHTEAEYSDFVKKFWEDNLPAKEKKNG